MWRKKVRHFNLDFTLMSAAKHIGDLLWQNWTVFCEVINVVIGPIDMSTGIHKSRSPNNWNDKLRQIWRIDYSKVKFADLEWGMFLKAKSNMEIDIQLSNCLWQEKGLV